MAKKAKAKSKPAKKPKPKPAAQPGTAGEVDRLKAQLKEARAKITALEARADIDPLLDIPNRRGFERELARALAYIKRYGTEAALIYLDLDGFKAINDAHGHAAGDALLKAVTAVLAAKVRASDMIGRLGGDEFALLLWNLGASQAAAKALDLERWVAQTSIVQGTASLSVGASAGVTNLSPGDTPPQAIEAADRAMYVRKNERRAGQAIMSGVS
ncbi:MAG: GGDEF domain-containing protein [Pseudolabrys sp.]|nr:GGDEF domain-containing protein [Pseudolabrys sp.]MBV9954235.1 GGDEF domain-containing protein [Pseudolabrys sp.]